MNIHHKFFIIGLGQQGLVHARLLTARSDVEVVGGYDLSATSRDNCKNKFSFPVYTDLLQGLKASLPEFIVIATPPSIRFTLFDSFLSITSLKMIITEKPLALSIHEALQMYSICKDNHWQLRIVHQSRFCDEFIALKECIREKRIGDLQFIKSACYGNLFNQGSHAVDLIRWVTENQHAQWVDATHNDDPKILSKASVILPTFERDQDHPGSLWTSINLRLTSGIEVFMSCGWLDVNPMPEMGLWLQRRLLAVGTKGYAEAHLASHYKEVISDVSTNKSFKTSPLFYLQSLEKFYDNLLNDLNQSEQNQKNYFDENLHTLAVLMAALSSGKHHQIISIPQHSHELLELDRYLDNPKTHVTISNDTDSLPILSVIIPMETHRGIAKEAITSWTVDQRCHRDQYEIIVVSPTHQKSFEPLLSQYLSPNDTLIFLDAENEIHLCHHGATVAKGQYLLFTESHCIAEPDSVAQAINFFKQNQGDSFYGHNLPICKNRISKMEARYYQHGFKQTFNKNYWAKVSLHAFGIKKHVYFEAGGFDYRYNRFSYWLLGANLFSKGFSVNYAPHVCIAHLFVVNMKMFEEFISECVVGECLYRMETPDKKFCSDFFSTPLEWNIARGFCKNLNHTLFKILFNHYCLVNRDKIKIYFKNRRNFLRKMLILKFGGLYTLLTYYFRMKLGKLVFYLSYYNIENQFKKFLNYQTKFSQFSRVRYIFSNPTPANKNIHKGNYILHQMDEEDIYGFYAPETYQNEYFRWTKDISAIKLSLAPKDWHACLNIFPIRQSQLHIQLYINSYPIKTYHEKGSTELKFSIPKNSLCTNKENWLILVTKSWDVFTDQRTLGIPIQSLNIYLQPMET